MKLPIGIAICLPLMTLAACGHTSNIQPSAPPQGVPAATAAKPAPLDLSGYDRVIVLDYVDATDKHKLKPSEIGTYADAVASAARTFPEIIARKVHESGAFKDVARGTCTGDALCVSGRITRLEEGNASLRLWIGMGAGSSYFAATTELSDAATGNPLGSVVTDKNSWPLGGALASAQTVQSFMEGAAGKIADQLRDSKRASAVAQTH
jgi:hypothetical protein